jgi:hypothetical protein
MKRLFLKLECNFSSVFGFEFETRIKQRKQIHPCGLILMKEGTTDDKKARTKPNKLQNIGISFVAF